MKTIKLPWPSPCLYVNNRSHWSVKAKSRAKQRSDCRYLALGTKPIRTLEIPITLTFCPPDKRRRDIDGLLSACKGLIDGIADAWGIDDSRFKLTLLRGPVVKGGQVLIDYEAME